MLNRLLKQGKQKIVSIAAIIVLVCSCCTSSFADDTRTSGLYTYTLKGNGTITIVEFDWEQNSGDIYVPSMIDGYTVTGIGDDAFYKNASQTVLLKKPDDVVIVLPNTITSIGKNAFKYTPISSIDIPTSVKIIADGAFAYSHIKKYSVAVGHEVYAVIDGALYDKKEKKLIAYPRLDSNDEIVSIPEGITEIGMNACAGIIFPVKSGNLDVLFPNTLRIIGIGAFQNARASRTKKGFTTTINVQEIKEGAFEGAALGRINVSASIIGTSAFSDYDYDHYSQGTIDFEGNVNQIGDYAFANKKDDSYPHVRFDNLIDMNSLTSIGCYAFSKRTIELSDEKAYQENGETIYPVDLPKSLTDIPEGAFENASIDFPDRWQVKGSSTIRLKIHEGIGSIGKKAFLGMGMHEIVFPNTLTIIGDQAFYGCIGLKSIVIPDSVETIGEEAFYECTRLSSVEIPSSVKTIGRQAFIRDTATLILEQGSYAEIWAQENGYSYKYAGEQTDDLDWLNN